MTKAEGLGLTVFFLYSSYPLTFLIFDIWNTQDYSNNIYSNRQYSLVYVVCSLGGRQTNFSTQVKQAGS
jgi:hypothetical protein